MYVCVIKISCNYAYHVCIVLKSESILGGAWNQVYGSSVNPPVRHKCLAAINKLIHFSTADMLRSLLNEANISRYGLTHEMQIVI
jgi:hypothetical protein